MSPLQKLLDDMTAIVDTYHAKAHDIATLIELRRELSGHNWHLANYVKQTYGTKSLTYTKRKHEHAKHIVEAMQHDESAVKKRPMNRLEIEAEASSRVMLLRNEEGMAEAEFEHVKAMLYAAKEVLSAMSQEIADARDERNYNHALDQIEAHEQARSGGAAQRKAVPEGDLEDGIY